MLRDDRPFVKEGRVFLPEAAIPDVVAPFRLATRQDVNRPSMDDDVRSCGHDVNGLKPHRAECEPAINRWCFTVKPFTVEMIAALKMIVAACKKKASCSIAMWDNRLCGAGHQLGGNMTTVGGESRYLTAAGEALAGFRSLTEGAATDGLASRTEMGGY